MNDLDAYIKAMVKEAVTESMQEIMKDIPAPGKKFPEIMTLKIAAEYLGMSRGYLYKVVARNEFATYPKGKTIYVKKSDLDSWFESTRIRPVAEYKHPKI
jgi:excisionase family DNA binding protein